MAKHYKKSPSASERWLNCPGSLQLSDQAPRQESSSYAAEGTRAHNVAEQALLGNLNASDITDDTEMADAVQVYLDEVRAFQAAKTPLVEFAERTLPHASIEAFGGTCDYMMIYEEDGEVVLHLFDYKHGVGVPVGAVENKQILSYFSIVGSHYPNWIDRYRGTIVQPRAANHDSVQTWDCTAERVAQHEQLVRDADKRNNLCAGDWCRWCPAISFCPELVSHTKRVAQIEFATIRDNQQELADLLKLAPAIRALLDRIPDALLQSFKDGKPVPGFKVVERLSNRKWTLAEKDVIKKLKEAGLTEDQIFRNVMKSPSQIEKVISDKSLLDGTVDRTHLGYNVVSETARGKPVQFQVDDFEELLNDEE